MSTDKNWVEAAERSADKLATLFEEVSKKAGPVAEGGWEIMVQGARAEALQSLLLAVPFALLWIMGAYLLFRVGSVNEAETEAIDVVISVPVSVVALAVSTAFLVGILHDVPIRLMAPEYVAAEKILEVIDGRW